MYKLRIYTEDLIANSFIAYLMHTNPKNLMRRLSLKKIEKYGNQVANNLKKHDIKVSLILSRDLTEVFFDKYSNWFRMIDDDIIELNDSVSIDDLIDTFTGYLNVDLLIEFNKRKNYKILVEND